MNETQVHGVKMATLHGACDCAVTELTQWTLHGLSSVKMQCFALLKITSSVVAKKTYMIDKHTGYITVPL